MTNKNFNSIKTMFELQDTLNNFTCWDNWKEWETQKGRKIDWFNCILLESAEAIDSFNWKHWKDINSSNDENNIKVEIVDIWHFIMSLVLELKRDNLKNIDKVINEFVNYKLNTNKSVIYGNKQRIESFKELMYITLTGQFKYAFDNLEFDLMTDEEKKEVDDYIFSILKRFELILVKNWMDFKELYKLYIVKNTLNEFRQRNGYATWEYEKIWDGKEDNIVALEIMSENENLTKDELYIKLTEIYQDIFTF